MIRLRSVSLRAGRIRTTTNDERRAGGREWVLRTSALASAGYAPYTAVRRRGGGRRRRGRRSMLKTAVLKPKSLHKRISPTTLMSAACSALSSNGKAERANGTDSVQARACTVYLSHHHLRQQHAPCVPVAVSHHQFLPNTEVFFFFMCEDGMVYPPGFGHVQSPRRPGLSSSGEEGGRAHGARSKGRVTSTLPTQAHTALPPIQYIYSLLLPRRRPPRVLL